MKTKVLVEVDLKDLNQDVVHDYAREAFNYRYPSEVSCDCENMYLDDYDSMDIVDHLTMKGYTVLGSSDFGDDLRSNMAMTELRVNLESGKVTIEMIEQLNNKVDER